MDLHPLVLPLLEEENLAWQTLSLMLGANVYMRECLAFPEIRLTILLQVAVRDLTFQGICVKFE